MFVGRKGYLANLNSLWGRDSGVLVTCRGRRRIGKSTLIEEFARLYADFFISIDGLPPRKMMTDKEQRRHFCEKIADYSRTEFRMAETWSQAFNQLNALLERRGRTVVLLDEISWMGGYNPDFAGYLKESWDKMLRKHPDLIFVLCGSVSAWIAENILDSTGFVGRDSMDIEVRELSLAESVQLLGPSAERWSTEEKLDLLSLTGGVPKYIEEMRPEFPVDENIRRTCFLPGGLLFREFDDLFSSVFGRTASTRGKIMKMLADGPKSAAMVAETAGKTANGSYVKTLKDLQLAGFVARDGVLSPVTLKPAREAYYRIKDNYARFYLRHIEPRKLAIENRLFEFSSLEQLRGWESILGLQFENLILNHVDALFPKLGLDHSLVLSAAPYVQPSARRREGCQIDLLIQTQRMLMVVEIKRRKTIGAEIIDEVSEKVRKLKKSPTLSVRTALVYAGHLSPSVPAERYFDFIVPAESLLSP